MTNGTQSNVLYSNELFKQYIMQMSTGIIWKNLSKALANESTDLVDLYLIELFINANRGLLNFDIIKSFPRKILEEVFVSPSEKEMIEVYAADKNKIPVDMRNSVVKAYETALSSYDTESGYPVFYTETNDYYRMLMGLPNKDDKDFVYVNNSKTPIHELPRVTRLELENDGILEDLIKKYPDKEYLKHIGRKSINPFKARVADKFDLLYHDNSSSDTLDRDFVDTYNSAKQLALHVYYSKSLSKSNGLYENFLAMSILFITIQSMQYKYLKVDITRDFYDIESLKLIYDSYGIPFYDEIPLEYHRKIVKNINKLISYKGSSQVFFDLFDIFDIGSIDVYQYFLTKTHIFDDKGNPKFEFKKDASGNIIKDINGNPIYDDKANYKIQFSRAKIYDDPALAVSDEANDTEYELITSQDPYWVDDDELMSKLAGEDFNYLESKYIGIQTVFDLMKITYENAYIFRMIIDNRELTDNLTFTWTDIGIECSIFDAFIYLATLYCARRGYKGIINKESYLQDLYLDSEVAKNSDNTELVKKLDEEIKSIESDESINGIPAVMDTLGYNFKEAINIINNAKSNSPYIAENRELIELISSNKITNLSSIDTIYDNIEKIRNFLINGYTNATTIEEYHAYRDLYKSLMVSKEIESVYRKFKRDDNNKIVYDKYSGKPLYSDAIHSDFESVLDDISPELMERYILLIPTDDANIDYTAIDTEMTIVIDQIESIITKLKYTSMSIGLGNSNLIDSLFKILNFFKSAKAELVGYNIIYTITMRGSNFFKMLDKMHSYIYESGKDDELKFKEILKIVADIFYHKHEIMSLIEDIKDKETRVYLEEYLESLDVHLVYALETLDHIFKDDTWYIDFMHSINTTAKLSSKMILEDISNLSLTSLDILEPRHFGLLIDNMVILKDALLLDPSLINTYNILDIIKSIDRLYRSIVTSNDKSLSSTLKIDSDKVISTESTLTINDNINDSYESLMILCNFIKDEISKYSDNITYNEFITNMRRDNQYIIDISTLMNEYIEKIDTSIVVDSLFEFNSNGEMILIK